MICPEEISELLQNQCERYPKLLPGDLLKALHQGICGCGHLVADPSAAAEFIRREAISAKPVNGLPIEPLGRLFCRVHLSYLQETGLSAETLAKLFALSAEKSGGTEELKEALKVLLAMTQNGRLPFSYENVLAEVKQWEQEGFPSRHHTEAFRTAYAPSYRVLYRQYAWALPVFAEIDRLLTEKKTVLVAIEGGAASGKSTLGELLKKVYDGSLFHMDDFFLRPEQRTPERYRQPGGNVDVERFTEEVMEPLVKGKTVQYRRFDCGTFQILPPVPMEPKQVNIVEGCYSCRPDLAGHYDLRVFLKIPGEVQEYRIGQRESAESRKRFFEKWIPLEKNYFEQLDIENSCDMVLEVGK